MLSQLTSRIRAPRGSRHCAPFKATRPCAAVTRAVCSATNGNSNGSAHKLSPSAAETSRTVVDLAREGALSTVASDGTPCATPVSYTLSKTGELLLQLGDDLVELNSLSANTKCCLLVQPVCFPARSIGAVSLFGSLVEEETTKEHRLQVERCIFYSGLDQSGPQQVTGEEFLAAEPDILRATAAETIATWNSERAEDMYRITSSHLGVNVLEMEYVELLWIDYMGMYVRAEVTGSEPTVVRVPFYRPVIDDRDVRSVVTMAAQLAWEKDRNYKPPVPSYLAELSANN